MAINTDFPEGPAVIPTVQQQPSVAVQPVQPTQPSQTLVRCSDGSLVAPGQPCPQTKTSWTPWIVGFVAVAAGVGVAYYIANQKRKMVREASPSRENPCPCEAEEEDEE